MTVSSTALNVTSAALRSSGWLCRVLGAENGLRIVFYDRVDATPLPYLFTSGLDTDAFEAHLDHLTERFTIVALSEALARSRAGEDLDGVLCLTFDDGLRECATEVGPRLLARNLPATFFVIEGCLGNTDLMWRNKVLHVENSASADQRAELARMARADIETAPSAPSEPTETTSLLDLSLAWPMDEKDDRANQLWAETDLPALPTFLRDEQPYLTDDQLRQLLAEGHEVGVHTKTHPFLDRLDDDALREEVAASCGRLNERFGVTVRAMSYPFGVRADRRREQVMLEGSTLEMVLGDADRLRNGTDPTRWERQCLESPPGESLPRFYLGPWVRRLRNLRQP